MDTSRYITEPLNDVEIGDIELYVEIDIIDILKSKKQTIYEFIRPYIFSESILGDLTDIVVEIVGGGDTTVMVRIEGTYIEG